MMFSLDKNNDAGKLLVATAYFPPVSYLAACVHAEEVVIEHEETYPKQTIRNHCNILGPNGKQTLSIPVIKVNGHHTKTRDIRLDSSTNWQMNHKRSILTAYGNSPYYLYYSDLFTPCLESHYEFLIDLNRAILQKIFEVIRITPKVTLTDTFRKEWPGITDIRYTPKKNINQNSTSFPAYTQVFSSRHPFSPDLSSLDLIFNLGPECLSYLEAIILFP
jgi:hypothetical protein